MVWARLDIRVSGLWLSGLLRVLRFGVFYVFVRLWVLGVVGMGTPVYEVLFLSSGHTCHSQSRE